MTHPFHTEPSVNRAMPHADIPLRPRTRAARGALAAVTLMILVLTLIPGAGGGSSPQIALEVTGFRFGADAIANTLLFIPFGAAAALWFGRGAPFAPVAWAATLSLAIELLQLLVPGRFTSPSDVVFNTVGAAAGMLLIRHAHYWLLPPPRLAGVLAAGTGAAVAVLLALGPLLFAPSIPTITLFGQWTAEFGDMARYEGAVVASSVGPVSVHSRAVRDTPRLRDALLAGDTVTVHFSAGPPPVGAAPLFSVYDAREREVLLLAADGTDLLVRYRMRSVAAGLDQPHLSFRDALHALVPGRSATLRFWRNGHRHCVAVDDEVTCRPGFPAAFTWALVLFPIPLTPLITALWLAALLLPVGFWSPRFAWTPVLTALPCTALLVSPLLASAAPPHPLHFAAALAGVGAGAWLRRRLLAVRNIEAVAGTQQQPAPGGASIASAGSESTPARRHSHGA